MGQKPSHATVPLNRVVVPARQAGNGSMDSLKGFQIRALVSGLCAALNLLTYIEPKSYQLKSYIARENNEF
jgi:hypothetical protein